MNKATIPRIIDVDRFLDGGTERAGADGCGNVVSNGTFSKIVAPWPSRRVARKLNKVRLLGVTSVSFSHVWSHQSHNNKR
jgi:hypothetical protein